MKRKPDPLILLAMKDAGYKSFESFVKDAYQWFGKKLNDKQVEDICHNLVFHNQRTDELTDYCLDIIHPPKEVTDETQDDSS